MNYQIEQTMPSTENSSTTKPKKPRTKKEKNSKQNDTTEIIKNIISEETIMNDIEKSMDKISTELNDVEKGVLAHMGNYIEEPYNIIESYFQGQHLERLVRHQIESYNHFVNYQVQRTIQMFNPVTVRSENDYVASQDKYSLELFISFIHLRAPPARTPQQASQAEENETHQRYYEPAVSLSYESKGY